MITKFVSSMIICGFILVILHTSPPHSHQLAAARKLEDIPQNSTSNSTVGYEEGKGQSKTGVHGSRSEHAGSATGDNTPTGTVQMPPPKAVTTVSYVPPSPENENENGQYVNGGSGGGNQQYNYYSPPDSPYYNGYN